MEIVYVKKWAYCHFLSVIYFVSMTSLSKFESSSTTTQNGILIHPNHVYVNEKVTLKRHLIKLKTIKS